MDTLFFIAKIVLGAYFIYSGASHFLRAKGIIGYATFKGLPMPALGVYISGAVMVLGGIGIITQMQLAWSYGSIAAFLVIAAFTIHTFWSDKDAQTKAVDVIQFQKNLALAAALLMLLAK